ncbi:MAG: cytochrome C oxidase subunit II, partial [Treponema sp.]|nr:cytochrome C oxidase subunit II [Treponema sp.]
EETRVLTRYTSREIADLIDAVGGADKFNTGEVEKSVVNMYGHLQGHIQRGVNELETHTNSILRQKTDVGAFVRGENAYSIVKCAFKDNQTKPKTVTDVKLSVNILDSELISPIFHYQATVEYLIKDLISKHIIDTIDKYIEQIKDDRLDQGLEELSDSQIIFSKINNVEAHTDDSAEEPKSKRYSYIAKALMERIADLRAEIDPENFDALNVRENIKKIVDIENIRSRGFNTAINSITAILDTSKMGYQYIENLKNGREIIIREYEDTDIFNLPDERYQIKLRYFDNAQLLEDRKAYDVQLKSFETEIMHLWDILEVIYQDSWKSSFKVNDFEDLAKKNKNRIRKLIKEKSGEPLYEDIAKVWDEISFVKPAETEVEKSNRTYVYEKDRVRTRIIMMRDKLRKMYDFMYPIERRVMEERLAWLEKEYFRFDYMINPYHLQPGLLLDVDITSIKRKKVTLNSMANVLNEFLSGVSKGFHDAAFASFSRRRSTVREDINQSFGSGEEPRIVAVTAQTAAEPNETAPSADAASKAAAPKKKPGVVDTKAKKPARGGSQLAEI